ncbi:hypothetical protein [Psychrobacter sp. I-STPA10]|uniref:hypothetical protein n=1 Tax=Psychrobacter sp. I-STPA10 TaxID=2585769 RepID=UPI001E4CF8AA|nr:hypothetical protein [Psychrobacter sp. I-STPA10]
MQIEISTAPPQIKNWLNSAKNGEPIIFTEQGQIVGRIAIDEPTDLPRRQAGLLAGVSLDPAFFEPLDDDELALWNGDSE